MILLLAGTGEGKQIATALSQSGVPVTASLAGATRTPDALPVPTRVGGYGGEAGFRAYVASEGITAVLDATHPFAMGISARTQRVCGDLGLPYAQVLRPQWEPQEGDNWTMIDAPAQAAEHVPAQACVFLATGRQTLADYGPLDGRRVLVRVIDPPTAPLPFEQGEFVVGRPPFTRDYERKLFDALGVTHLVVKNAGGDGGRAKLDAARDLGLPVVMLRRPLGPSPLPAASKLNTVQGALDWAHSL